MSEARAHTPATAFDAYASSPFFVVGCPRSGTTLLRLMLDSHPRLAVPGESHFIVAMGGKKLRSCDDPDEALKLITAHKRFGNWNIDPDCVRELAAEVGARTFADVVRASFAVVAAREGKLRWGDKTPGYVEHLDLLASLFPDAVFVHLIRDGREVAASIADRNFGPRSAVAAAFWWRRKVGLGRRSGTKLGPQRYLEARLENLIADPEGELRRICGFIGENYDPAMLRYQETARERLPPGHVNRGHKHVVLPPTPGLRDWRHGLSRTDQRGVEAVCRRQLVELGYPAAKPDPLALLRAWAIRANTFATLGWRWSAERRLRPATTDI